MAAAASGTYQSCAARPGNSAFSLTRCVASTMASSGRGSAKLPDLRRVSSVVHHAVVEQAELQLQQQARLRGGRAAFVDAQGVFGKACPGQAADLHDVGAFVELSDLLITVAAELPPIAPANDRWPAMGAAHAHVGAFTHRYVRQVVEEL